MATSNSQGHFAKECRANIEIVTPDTARCRICGQTYQRTNYWGKEGWQRRKDDKRLIEYIRQGNV